ncbi:hypothetical protein J4448_02375 [Candidatus Woesearchaeota archaeon]|nr:hypothetical protein [Candidatus Woesearchaeota archaeon]
MEGVEAVFKRLGPGKAIKFFQSMGLSKGDSVKEIESITEKMSKEDIMKGIRKSRRA